MKVLLSWLNDYGDFADPSDPSAVERVAGALTDLGIEIGAIEHVGGSIDGVVTARVLRLEQQHAFEHDRGLPEHPGLEVALGQRHQVLRIA